METKKVAAYIRVSTDGQTGEDKFGLEAQKTQIIEYCSTHNMEIIKWYSDEGESGAKYRKGFDEIIYGEVQNPPIEAVVVAKSDRVARDINIYFYYQACLLKKDIELISVQEDFGQLGVFSNALKAFVLVCAEMERENITKRTMGGRKVKAAQGGYSGGRAPFGYKVVNGCLVVNPDEVNTVFRIYDLRKQDATYQSICNTLYKEGYRTRRGTKFTVSTVKSILDNEKFYKGYYRYSGSDWVKGQHEAIL